MSYKSTKNILSVSARILMALAFVFGQTAWAGQNQGTQNKPDANGKDQTQQAQATASHVTQAKAQPVEKEQAPAQSSAAEDTSHRGGQREGIKVHGHWTIEVRNPNGSLANHREFENSLQPGSSGGAYFLSGILGRQFTVGAWEIELQAHQGGNTVTIDEPGSPVSQGNAALCLANPTTSACSTNLTVASANGTLTLAGSAVIPSSFGAAVTFVVTADSWCLPTATPAACPTAGNTGVPTITARALDGLNGDPQAVPVSAGQTVAVTVVISFS